MRNYKLLLILVVALTFCLSANAQTPAFSITLPTDQLIVEMVGEIQKLNPEITHPDTIWSGQKIRVPGQGGIVVEYTAGDTTGWKSNGCLWWIIQGHISRQVINPIDPTPQPVITAPIYVMQPADDGLPWLVFIIFLVIVAIAAYIAFHFINKYRTEAEREKSQREENQQHIDNENARIAEEQAELERRQTYLNGRRVDENGAHADEAERNQQLTQHYPEVFPEGSISRSTIGTLRKADGRHDAPDHWTAKVRFADGERDAEMHVGDEVVQVLKTDGTTVYVSRFCANLVQSYMENEITELPDGIIFVPNPTTDTPDAIESTAGTSPEPSAIEAALVKVVEGMTGDDPKFTGAIIQKVGDSTVVAIPKGSDIQEVTTSPDGTTHLKRFIDRSGKKSDKD